MESLFDILKAVWELIQAFPSLASQDKIIGILVLVIGLVKSSALRPLWDALGAFKVLVAPAMAVILAVVSVKPFTVAALAHSIGDGMLAIALYQMLDAVKSMPMIGPKYVAIIAWVMKLLKSPEVAKK